MERSNGLSADAELLAVAGVTSEHENAPPYLTGGGGLIPVFAPKTVSRGKCISQRFERVPTMAGMVVDKTIGIIFPTAARKTPAQPGGLTFGDSL